MMFYQQEYYPNKRVMNLDAIKPVIDATLFEAANESDTIGTDTSVAVPVPVRVLVAVAILPEATRVSAKTEPEIIVEWKIIR